MEIRPIETEFHADGRTDMSKLIVDFRNFADAPKTIFEHRTFWSYCHYVIMVRCLTVL
jgi:hypothetical protein